MVLLTGTRHVSPTSTKSPGRKLRLDKTCGSGSLDRHRADSSWRSNSCLPLRTLALSAGTHSCPKTRSFLIGTRQTGSPFTGVTSTKSPGRKPPPELELRWDKMYWSGVRERRSADSRLRSKRCLCQKHKVTGRKL